MNTVQVIESKVFDSVRRKNWNSLSGASYAEMLRDAVQHVGSGAARILCNGQCGWREIFVFGGKVVELLDYSQATGTAGLAGDNPRPVGTSMRTAPDAVLAALLANSNAGDGAHLFRATTVDQFAESLAK